MLFTPLQENTKGGPDLTTQDDDQKMGLRNLQITASTRLPVKSQNAGKSVPE